MGRDNDFHQKVSAGAAVNTGLALLTDPDALAIVNARRNGDINGLAVGDIAGSAAVGALVFDDLAGSAAVRTGLDIADRPEEGLLGKDDLAFSSALGTHLGRCSRLGAGPVTGGAGILEIQGQLFLSAENSLQEGDPHAGADIGALHGTVGRPS